MPGIYARTERHDAATTRYLLRAIPAQTRHFSGIMRLCMLKNKRKSATSSRHLTGIFPVILAARVSC